MKLRVVYYEGKYMVLCPDGTIKYANDDVLASIFRNIATPEKLSGEDGFWDVQVNSIEEYPGKTVAWISDDNILSVMPNNPFCTSNIEYLSVKDYAKKHGVAACRVRVLCREGRIPGVTQAGAYYMVPSDAPYPGDARRRENR